MFTADYLKEVFGCKDDAELGVIFNRSGSVVSVWRQRGVPAAIERRANELMRERGITPDSDAQLLAKEPLAVQMLVAEMDGMSDIEILEWIVKIKKAKAALGLE